MRKFLILFLLISQYSFACKCEKRSLQNEISISKYILSGEVIEKENNTYTVKVNYQWKGKLSDTIVLNQNISSCHMFRLEKGSKYLIYLSNYKPNSISHCSRSIKLKYSQDIYKLHNHFKTIQSKTKEMHLAISDNYLNEILDISDLKKIDKSNSYFVFRGLKKSFLKMNFKEFLEFDHHARKPIIKRIETQKRLKQNLNLYTFYYSFPPDKRNERRLIRKFKRQIKI